jgi:hypothetical protein
LSRKRSSFSRAKATRLPYKRFLIVCEGEKSEPDYIQGVKGLCREKLISIEIIGGAGQTKKVIERAVQLKSEAIIEAKRNKDNFEKFDSIWCVIDVDNHDLLTEALIQARDNKIEVSLSNPCYEVWVVLHHRDHRKSVDRSVLQSECKNHYGLKDKHVAFEVLWPAYSVARERARQLRAWQKDMGRFQGDPWTDFDLLVEDLLTLRRE